MPAHEEDTSIFTRGTKICNEEYIIAILLGRGAFGQVFLGYKIQNQDGKTQRVAIKIENKDKGSDQLLTEIEVFKKLQQCNTINFKGIPRFHRHGVEKGHTIMVMDLLGPNLYELQQLCGGKFSIKTVLYLGMQLFQNLFYIHQVGYVYRDVKPENLVMGIEGKSHILHIVDFGLSKRYRDEKTKIVFPYKENTQVCGTPRYVSVNTHLGIQCSRRDDLQSACYMLIYFLKAELPWQGFKADDRFEKDNAIMEMKLKVSLDELCQGVPPSIKNILSYCKSLTFYDEPDYAYILKELRKDFKNYGFAFDNQYDWVRLSEKHHKGKFLNLQINKHGEMEWQEHQPKAKVQKISLAAQEPKPQAIENEDSQQEMISSFQVDPDELNEIG